MDRQTHPSDRGGRALLTAALLILVATTAAAFGRVFIGRAPTVRLVAAAAVAVLLAAALERRHLALSLGVSLLGLVVALGLLVFPRTTLYGVPTATTLESALRALGKVGSQAQNRSAPVEMLPSLFGAALVAIWAASYSSHALAARAGSALLGLVPPAALLGFAGVVVEDGARPAYAGVFLLAALAALFAARMRRLDRWGPILPRRSRAPVGLALGPAGRGARRLGVGVTLVALFAPGLLPGFGADAVLDLDGGGDDGVSIRPLVDIRPSLLRNPALELFTVEADRASYWRLLSLDEYTGRFWRSTDPEAEQGATIDGRGLLARDRSALPGRTLRQGFHITRLRGVHLPAAYPPVGAAVSGLEPFRHDPDGTSLVMPDGLDEDFRYTITSQTITPSPDELDRQFDFSTVDPRYTTLPADTPPQVRAFAEEITAGTTTPYRQALAIQNLLRTYTYDEQAPAGHGIDDLLFFLESRRGYCEQFAGTMSVLLRSLGYPARVAVGFLPGTQGPDGLWHVTTQDAHSWVEMFFPGYGWLAFEPTPTRNNPVAAPYLSGIAFGGGSTFQGELGQLQQGGELPRGRLDPRLEAVERRFGRTSPAIEDVEDGTEGPMTRRLLPFTPAAVLLALGLIPVARWRRRRHALRRAKTPRAKTIVAYELFELRAADVGIGRRDGETLDEYRRRLEEQVAFSDGHLERLTRLARLALYSVRSPSPEESRVAIAATRALTTDVRRHAGRTRTILAAFRPASRE